MNPPWKDNRYSLIQWTCSYHKRRYRIRKTASMQWYNPRLWSYRKTWRNVTHPSDVSASRCRGSLVLATADRNRRLPLCWRAPSCRQKYRKTWRNVTRPIPPTCLPHGVAAACFVLATADKKAETHNHLSIHQWVRSAIFAPQQHASPIGFLFLKLPSPPCAVLLVTKDPNNIQTTSWSLDETWWKQLSNTFQSIPKTPSAGLSLAPAPVGSPVPKLWPKPWPAEPWSSSPRPGLRYRSRFGGRSIQESKRPVAFLMFLGAVSPNCWNCFGPAFLFEKTLYKIIEDSALFGYPRWKDSWNFTKISPSTIRISPPRSNAGIPSSHGIFGWKWTDTTEANWTMTWTMTHDPLRLTWIVLKASFPSQLDSLQQTAYIRGPYLSSHTWGWVKTLYPWWTSK